MVYYIAVTTSIPWSNVLRTSLITYGKFCYFGPHYVSFTMLPESAELPLRSYAFTSLPGLRAA
jgi:hypothetical protein